MDYIALIEAAPILLLWTAPLLALSLTIFLVLVMLAWLHDIRTASRQ
jgi:hypothetical protein